LDLSALGLPNALTQRISASIPWLPWSKRFSIRTLLVGMTLIVVVLALFV